MKQSRPQFQKRIIRLIGPQQRDAAHAVIDNLPIDPDRPLELEIREEKKARGLDQNSAMWVGPLADIAEQAWVEGRQYADVVWHELFKRKYLPELDDPELEDLVQNPETYRKWAEDPETGERILIGSTTQLTRKGMTRYLTQVEAYGANLGVLFHANPRMVA